MAEQQDGDGREPQPIDEEAAWAAIVAGYGEEPADPPGAKPFRPVENLSLPEPEEQDEDGDAPEIRPVKGTAWKPRPKPAETAETAPEAAEGAGPDEADGDPEPGPERPALGSSIVFAPGVRTGGPRDYSPAEPDDGPGGADEGHFVPPEPPPLPEADATTKFAWLAVVGGPVLMLVAVLLQWDMTWWLTTLCVGGFLGGFATLVARMKHDDDDDDGFDDPGRGAVV
ncbi:hypothetical protein [Streptomyces tanashiensis]|uniref:DUF308 domain-containing protein n=1 Tax=Streptomyces tanashiensis TaxID=67367 RepID=A0ABY6R5N9_9ACTN|nr:hypothetical protein [Streptomyces tanashiensis]UZX24423.1 hypothetical protein LDH80_28615 [Streptomyces tanashiensis]GGY13015.1 hypothetical protein GCM10010299_16950 [Streptomyces tanashiensis]